MNGLMAADGVIAVDKGYQTITERRENFIAGKIYTS
jgi:hypothetical protein